MAEIAVALMYAAANGCLILSILYRSTSWYQRESLATIHILTIIWLVFHEVEQGHKTPSCMFAARRRGYHESTLPDSW